MVVNCVVSVACVVLPTPILITAVLYSTVTEQ